MEKKYLYWLITGFTITLVLISFINYSVDPAQIFGKGSYEEGISDILVNGMNAVNCSNYDDRILQRFYINRLSKKKDTIVLGSSRTMLIRSAMYPDTIFFNNSMSGATLEDYMAVYGLYYKKNLPPQRIIIGVDPWIFNRYSGAHQWERLKNEYTVIRQRLDLKEADTTYSEPQAKYLELISYAYLLESIDVLTTRDSGITKGSYFPSQDTITDLNVKCSDGSIIYDKQTRERSRDKVQAQAVTYASQQPVYLIENYKQIDPERKDMFESFIQLLHKDGIEVTFYFPPYHPTTYSMLINSDRYRIVQDVEKYLRQCAYENNIQVRGSYNPAVCGCTEEDFFDGMHTNERGIKKALSFTQ